MKMSLINMKMTDLKAEHIYMWMLSHQDSFWHRGHWIYMSLKGVDKAEHFL